MNRGREEWRGKYGSRDERFQGVRMGWRVPEESWRGFEEGSNNALRKHWGCEGGGLRTSRTKR
eukprot:3199725-Alexandrium_andersonii.AAC.1